MLFQGVEKKSTTNFGYVQTGIMSALMLVDAPKTNFQNNGSNIKKYET